jgi:amidase
MKPVAVCFRMAIPSLLLLVVLACQMKTSSRSVPPAEITIAELQQGYAEGEYSVRQVVQGYIDRINAIDRQGPHLNSVITINPDALTIADSLDAELDRGIHRGPLHGIPILLKDNIDTHDRMPTTAGSRVLQDSYPPRDSRIAEDLRTAGAVILGKTNLSEWANYRASFSSSGWSAVGGQTKNPYVLDRNPCGSSSGSAVAVAANLCAAAIGTETWGSIICPSNANGIVGIKPTVGLWSRSGIVPISHTQDTAGPMARTVEDAAILLGALTGIDSSDQKTLASADRFHTDYTPFLNPEGLAGKRIGYLNANEDTHFKVDTLMHRALDDIETAGAVIVELDRIVEGNPYQHALEVMAYEFKHGLNAYLTRLGEQAPVSSLAEVIDSTRADSLEMRCFDLQVMETALSKGDLDSPEYRTALHSMLRAFRQEGLDRIMDRHDLDAIVAPSGSPAWKTDLINGDNFMLSSSAYAALSGYPNINVPMGFVGEVPVGLSFFGRAWSEPVLLELAYSYEHHTRHRRPPRFLQTDEKVR